MDPFSDNDFDYIIIDETHHATTEIYPKVSYYVNRRNCSRQKGQRKTEAALYEKGEKPDTVIDYPVDAPIMRRWKFSIGIKKPQA